jgi:hypothetical protein
MAQDDDPHDPYKVYERDELKGTYATRADGLNLTPIPRWPDSEATNGNCPTVRDSDILFMPLRRRPMMADTMASAPAT